MFALPSESYLRTLKEGSTISGKIRTKVSTTQEGDLNLHLIIQESNQERTHDITIQASSEIAKDKVLAEDIQQKFSDVIEKEITKVKNLLVESTEAFDTIKLPQSKSELVAKHEKPFVEEAPKPPSAAPETATTFMRRPLLRVKRGAQQVAPQAKPQRPISPEIEEKEPLELPRKKAKAEEPTIATSTVTQPAVSTTTGPTKLSAADRKKCEAVFNQAVADVQKKLRSLAENQAMESVEKCLQFHQYLIGKKQELDTNYKQLGQDISLLNEFLPESIFGLNDPQIGKIIGDLEQVFIGKLIRFAGEKLDDDFRNILGSISTCYNKCVEKEVHKSIQGNFLMLKSYRYYLECQPKRGLTDEAIDPKIKQEAGKKVGEILKQTTMATGLISFFQDMMEKLPKGDKAKTGKLHETMLEVGSRLVEFQQRLKALVPKEQQNTLQELWHNLNRYQESGQLVELATTVKKLIEFFGENLNYKEAINILPLYENLQNYLIKFIGEAKQFYDILSKEYPTKKGDTENKKLNKHYAQLFDEKNMSAKVFHQIGFDPKSKRFDSLIQHLTQKMNLEAGNYELYVKDLLTFYPETNLKRGKILESFIRYKLENKLQQ